MNEHSIVLKLDANGVAAGIDQTTKSLKDLEIAEDKVTASSARLSKEQKQQYDLYKIGATAAAQATREVAAQAKELETLRSRLDPAYASTQKLAQSQATLSTALKNGSISITEYNSLLAKAGQSTSIMDKYSHQFGRTLLDLTPIISGLGLLTLAHGAIQATDQYTKLTSQLKIATNSTSEYAFAMSEVKRISSAAQVDIGAIGSLYQRLSLATQASGTSQKQVATITETVALGLKANGASARESASAMLQLSQSFGSGRMAGEEFNSMAEAAPNVLRALATSMHVPYGALKQLASEGKITTEVMVKAFTDPALLAAFQAQAKSMRTITGSWTELTNALVLYVGKGSQTSGAVSILSDALTLVANNVKLIGDTLIVVSGILITRFVAALGLSAFAAFGLVSANVSMAASFVGITIAAPAAAAAIGEVTIAARILQLAAGPIGWITLLLGAGATAWMLWGKEAKAAGGEVESSVGKAARMSADKSMEAFYKYAKEHRSASQKHQDEIKEADNLFYDYQLKAATAFSDKMVQLQSLAQMKKVLIASDTRSDAEKTVLLAGLSAKEKEVANSANSAELDKLRLARENIHLTEVKISEAEKWLKKLNEEKVSLDGIVEANKKLTKTEATYHELLVLLNTTKDKSLLKDKEKLIAQAKANIGLEDAKIAIEKHAEAYKKVDEESKKSIETLDKSIAAQRLHNEEIGKTPEQIALIKAATEERGIAEMQMYADAISGAIAYAGIEKDIYILELNTLNERIAKRKELAGLEAAAAPLEAAKKVAEEQKKQQEKLWTDIDGFAHTAFNNITMKGKNAFAEIGKAIKESILDMLYKMTIQKWIFNIAGVSGGVAGAGAAGATDMFGGGSGGGGLGGLVNAGQSLWSAFSGGMASGMGSVMTTAGEMLGSTALTEMGWGATAAAQGSIVSGGFAGMGAGIASAIPWIAGGLAVLSLLGSFSSSSTSITGSGLNIAGKVGAPSTSGYTTGVTNESSWWGLDSSSSSWRTGSPASKETSLAITNMFAQIRSAIVLSGAAIGKDATALDTQIANFTISIGDLSLAGMDAAKQQEAITKAVSGMADSMVAQLVPGMERFQQTNETLLQTLVRVATEVMTLNGFYLSLGVTTRATTASADKLSVALGGVTQASALMTSFVAGFAPEAQKTALALGTLKSAGLPMAEFLTTTQSWWDFAKIASAEQLTAILKNQDVIKSWVTAMEAASKAMQDKAIADYKAAVDATNSLRAFALSVRELQRSLWAGSQTPLSSTYDVTRSQFAAINASAGAGDTNAQGNLAGSATAFLDAAKKQAVSAIEYARDFAFVQNSLDATATLADQTVSVADQQLEQLRLANSWLAVIATANQQQSVSSLVGTATSSVGAVNSAMSSQASSAAKSIADANALAAEQSIIDAAAADAKAVNAANSAKNIALKDAAKAELDILSAIPLRTADYYGDGGRATMASFSKLAQSWNIKHNAEVAVLQSKYDALPAFATGINEVPFDMNARIHAGEEIKPRAYVEKDKEDKKETNELLRKLVAANDEMKKELIAIKSSNYRIQVVEEKWDIEGTPSERLAA